MAIKYQDTFSGAQLTRVTTFPELFEASFLAVPLSQYMDSGSSWQTMYAVAARTNGFKKIDDQIGDIDVLNKQGNVVKSLPKFERTAYDVWPLSPTTVFEPNPASADASYGLLFVTDHFVQQRLGIQPDVNGPVVLDEKWPGKLEDQFLAARFKRLLASLGVKDALSDAKKRALVLEFFHHSPGLREWLK